jgi:hypothetical protein
LAAAVDALLQVRDPFQVFNPSDRLTPSADPNTRVVIFVGNLQLLPGEQSSAVVVNLIDSNNVTYNIPADDVRTVPNFSFTQVTFRLPNNLAVGNCTISVSAHGQVSNSATIRIKP